MMTPRRRLPRRRVDRSVTRCVRGADAVGGGAFAVGSDQVGDVALIEAVAQAPPTLHPRSRGTQGC